VVDTHAKVVVVKGCSLVWLLLSAELYWGELIVEENQKRRLEFGINEQNEQSECIAFSFFSRFVLDRRFQRIEKGNECLFFSSN